MKLLIELPEEMWKRVKDGYVPLGISKYLKNGKPYNLSSDLISRSWVKHNVLSLVDSETRIYAEARLDNAPPVAEIEEPLFAVCRGTAIEQNLPLYFVYYEETGILEVYLTKTNELFEKRRCSKHLSNYQFKEIVTKYLDWYPDWERGYE